MKMPIEFDSTKSASQMERIPNMVDATVLHAVGSVSLLIPENKLNVVKTIFQEYKNIKVLRGVKHLDEKRISELTEAEVKLALPYNVYRDNHEQLYAMYESEKFLGKGGYGRVKLGQNLNSGKWVAIKMEDIDPKKKEHILEKIEREIKFEKEANLYLGKIFFRGEHQDTHFTFQRYIFGEPMADLIRQGKFKNLLQKVQVGILALKAVIEWHEKGFIHGDIKPRNMLVDLEEMQLKLIDFGLSHETQEKEKLIVYLESMAGTEDFMAPELNDEILIDGEVRYAMTDKTESFAVGETINRLLYVRGSVSMCSSVRIMVSELVTNLSHTDPKRRISVKEALERLREVRRHLWKKHPEFL